MNDITTIPLEGVEFTGNSVNELLLSSIFELEVPVPDIAIRTAGHMIKDIKEAATIAELAVAATGTEWIPASCGDIPVAYNPADRRVCTLLILQDERFLVTRDPWAPVALPVWQEV